MGCAPFYLIFSSDCFLIKFPDLNLSAVSYAGQPLKKKTSDQVVDADDLQMDEDEDDNEEDGQEVDNRNRAKTRYVVKRLLSVAIIKLKPRNLILVVSLSFIHGTMKVC